MRKIAKTTKNQQKIKSHHEDSKKQAKEYYEKNKKRLQEHVPNKYRELSNEEKDIKRIIEEIDKEICLKKTNKNWENIKILKVIVKQRKYHYK